MAQQVIDVDGTPTLFSPVPANQLMPGDLVCDADGGSRPWRTPLVEHRDGVTFIEFEECGGVVLGTNVPVLRAVGANSGRGGAR